MRWADCGAITRSAMLDLADALLGRQCPGCAGGAPRRRPICDSCDARVPRSGVALCLACLAGASSDAITGRRGCPRHGPSRLLLAGPHYEAPLDRILHAFKYGGARECGAWIASLLPEPPGRDGAIWRGYVLVPVPLHAARRARRGFDQALLLAEIASARWGIPVVRALERVRDHEPQARMGRDRRHANVRDAFRLVAAAAVRGRPVLLMDDVATTGSTLLEAAAALEPGAPTWILAVTAAHGGLAGGSEPASQAEVAGPGPLW